MDYLFVAIAGVAGYAFGAIWHMSLGKRWQVAAGLSDAAVRGGGPAPYVVAFVANILVAGMMRRIFVRAGVEGAANAAISGGGLGLFIAAPYLATNYAFAMRPRALALIGIGHAVGSATAIGVALDLLL